MQLQLRKKSFAVHICILFCAKNYSQGEASIWYFGHNAGLDFNGGAPIVVMRIKG